MSSKLIDRNITIAYILSFFNELFFPITAWLFFYLKYLDFPQIAILTGVSGFASNLFEIPTGAFADIVGRRTAIFLSYLLFSIAMFGIAFSSNFWSFLFFVLINSLCNSLFSGSMEALVYDSLKEDKREISFDKIITRLEAFTWIGLFLGAISGGFMYQFWFRLPYIAQGIITLIAALISLKLYEPKLDSITYNLKSLFKQNVLGFKELFSSLKTANISFIFIVIGAGYFIASSILGISQLNEYGMNASEVGIIFAVGYLIAALASFVYPQLKNKFSTKFLIVISVFILLCSFIFANKTGIILGSLLVIARIASSTTFRNSRSIILNKFISSSNRATSLSTMVLLSQLPYAILAYPIGILIKNSSPNLFAFLLGITILLILSLQYLIYRILLFRKV